MTTLIGSGIPRDDRLSLADTSGSWTLGWRVGGWWVGPAFSVEWLDGDTIPSFECPDGVPDSVLYVGDWNPDVLVDYLRPDVLAASPFGTMRAQPGTPSDAATAVGDGSGVAFFMQQAVYDQATTSVAQPPVAPDVDTTQLIAPVAVFASFTYPPEDIAGDGARGDFWVYNGNSTADLPGQSLYHKDDRDQWQPVMTGLDAQFPYEVAGQWTVGGTWQVDGHWTFGYTTDLGVLRMVTSHGTVPDDSLIETGQAAMWWHSFPGEEAVFFKGRNDDGDIVTGSIPLT